MGNDLIERLLKEVGAGTHRTRISEVNLTNDEVVLVCTRNITSGPEDAAGLFEIGISRNLFEFDSEADIRRFLSLGETGKVSIREFVHP